MSEGIWGHDRPSSDKVSFFLSINIKSHEANGGCSISSGVRVIRLLTCVTFDALNIINNTT